MLTSSLDIKNGRCLEPVISFFLSSPKTIRLGDSGILDIYIIFYFGVVSGLVFKICINSCTQVFLNFNQDHRLFLQYAIFFCMQQVPFLIHNNIKMIIKMFCTICLSLVMIFNSVPLYWHNESCSSLTAGSCLLSTQTNIQGWFLFEN